jgi:death-on-curing family protein
MAEPYRDDADVIGHLLMRVYEIHERVIARDGGGLEGIRDAALLHAAVARPFATFGEVELYPTDFDKAAALFHSLIKSYPFMEGTKRTAFAAAVYVLHARGYMLQRPFLKDEIIRFCVGLAEEGQRLAEGQPVAVQTIMQIAEWLQGLVAIPASEET